MTGLPRDGLIEQDGDARDADLVVLGAGVAGLTVAIEAARHGLRAVVLTKADLGQSATRYAQGGVAAAVSDDDSPDLHRRDTLAAGGTLCDTDAVRVLVDEGPARVGELIARGAVFDRRLGRAGAALALAREGGHSRPRVVHAGGDATGAEVGRALLAAAQGWGVELRERWFAADLVVRDGRCAGVTVVSPDGCVDELGAGHVVLSSGGSGQLFEVTTNPMVATGDGVAMALRAGVAVADLEFVQFHPTALHRNVMPRPLLSEALRGEGAVLRDDLGDAFMVTVHELGDLAPRDVVARGIVERMATRNLEHVWLDATSIEGFAARFPTVWQSCRDIGLDPTTDWLPVAPAAHYSCGGVLTDLDGATTLPGLWACGEVACSGVNGANRLASNSLLEGLVFGRRVVEAIVAGVTGPSWSGALAPLADVHLVHVPIGARLEAAAGETGGPGIEPSELRRELQRAMSSHAGVVRDSQGLARAGVVLDRIAALESACGATPTSIGHLELRNLVTVGRALLAAATAREESRGCHTRGDFPSSSDALEGRFVTSGRGVHFAPLAAPVHALPSASKA